MPLAPTIQRYQRELTPSSNPTTAPSSPPLKISCEPGCSSAASVGRELRRVQSTCPTHRQSCCWRVLAVGAAVVVGHDPGVLLLGAGNERFACVMSAFDEVCSLDHGPCQQHGHCDDADDGQDGQREGLPKVETPGSERWLGVHRSLPGWPGGSITRPGWPGCRLSQQALIGRTEELK